MCPYRNTKALCSPTEYFLFDEADQNRPLISETAGVINCVFIFRGGREHGTKFSTYVNQWGRQIKRGQRWAHQGTSVQKPDRDMMKCECCNTVHYDEPLLPLCVCFHNVITDFTASTREKSGWFVRSHAASAQRPVNTIQFIITVLIRVYIIQSSITYEHTQHQSLEMMLASL